ncbi:MAG: hypothetical protein AB7U83_12255 [Vicinamibacterales bacterium]
MTSKERLAAAVWLTLLAAPVAAQTHGPAPAPVESSPHRAVSPAAKAPATAAAGPVTPDSAAAQPPAPAAAASPVASPGRPVPVKLGEVRGRINAALATMPAPAAATATAKARRASAPRAPAAPPPRFAVRWPEERWRVQWPSPARLDVTWPQ